MSSKREYFDLFLKNQSKPTLKKLNDAIAHWGLVIHDQLDYDYYEQKWRNPIDMRVSLPKGTRWKCIQATRLILHRPPIVSIGFIPPPPIPLRGDHDKLRSHHCRTYRINPANVAYIWDGQTGERWQGSNVVQRVLNGELNLVLRSS